MYITGDIHGGTTISKLNSTNFPEGKYLTEKDIVIITGDFGMPWHSSGPNHEKEKKVLKWLSDKKWTTLFVDGNHENFDLLSSLPTEKRYGAEVGVVQDRVYHLKRGNVYEIEGRKVLAIGGATSTDKEWRQAYLEETGNKIWWEEEILSAEEEINILRAIKQPINIIISHTAPSRSVLELLTKYPVDKLYDRLRIEDPVAVFLDKVRSFAKFQKWFCGHMHMDYLTIDEAVQFCFDNIFKI